SRPRVELAGSRIRTASRLERFAGSTMTSWGGRTLEGVAAMSKKSVWDAFAFACARAIHEEDPWASSWVCTAEDAKHNWDVEEPKPEGDGIIVYNSDPEAGEVKALRKVLAEAGCKELGYAEYPDAGVAAGHTFVMVIDAGALQDWEVGDLTAAARKRLRE